MTAHSGPAIALYTGDARLWQNANVIQAPSIQFDRDHRSVVAQGSPAQPVSTVLVQVEKSGKVTPVKITSDRLTYTDSERKAHFEEAVQAKGAELTITAKVMDVYLQPREQAAANQSVTGTSLELAQELERSITSSPGITSRSSSQAGERPAISCCTPLQTTSSS